MNEIQILEERLRQAQLLNDVSMLDELIANELQFVMFDGAIVTKEMDLASHRTKAFQFQQINFSEQNIRNFGHTAVVTVKAHIIGFAGETFVEGNFRYCRTWHFKNDRWQIIAGSVTTIQK